MANILQRVLDHIMPPPPTPKVDRHLEACRAYNDECANRFAACYPEAAMSEWDSTHWVSAATAERQHAYVCYLAGDGEWREDFAEFLPKERGA